MGVENIKQIGQPGPQRMWPHAEIEDWLEKNAWVWVSAQDSRMSPGSIGTWPDLSDNGHPFRQTTGVRQPALELGVLNGYPGVHFTRTPPAEEDEMTNSHGADEMLSDSGTRDREFIVLVQTDDGDPNRQGILSSQMNDSFDMHIGRDVFDQVGTYRLRTAQTGASSSWPTVGTFPGVGVPFLWDLAGSDWLGAAVWESWVNGDKVLSGTDGDVTSFSDGLIEIGRATHASGQFWLDGYLFEVIIFNKIITQDRRDQIKSFINDKWKLSL